MRYLAFLFALVGSQAHALSCAPPSLERSFLHADEADAAWWIIEGRISYDASQVPKRDLLNNFPEDAELPARLEGLGLTGGGFLAPVDMEIILRVTCAGPWCGGNPGDGTAIYFVEEREEGWTHTSSPCPAWSFEASEDAEARLLSCLEGEACAPKD
ncbi:MAG: hypothetical protein AAF330_02570 [Pseudomonadota bacterium]